MHVGRHKAYEQSKPSLSRQRVLEQYQLYFNRRNKSGFAFWIKFDCSMLFSKLETSALNDKKPKITSWKLEAFFSTTEYL